jgi:hypothetical protein
LSNDLGAGDGKYPVLARVTDWESDQNLGKIDAWQVSTVEVSTQYAGNGWARTWGGSSDDWGYSVAVNGSGDEYVTGLFHGGVFLSKFDSSGTFVWARTWSGSSSGVAVDGSGNVYVTGIFSGTSVDFNPDPPPVDPHSSNGSWDVFLSRFDSSGTFVWARTWGGSDNDTGYDVAADGSGNVYVTGWFQGTSVDFDPDPTAVDLHSSNGAYDAFLSKFMPDGSW